MSVMHFIVSNSCHICYISVTLGYTTQGIPNSIGNIILGHFRVQPKVYRIPLTYICLDHFRVFHPRNTIFPHKSRSLWNSIQGIPDSFENMISITLGSFTQGILDSPLNFSSTSEYTNLIPHQTIGDQDTT